MSDDAPARRYRTVKPLNPRTFLLLSTIATFLGVVAIILAIEQCDVAMGAKTHTTDLGPPITSSILACLCFLVAAALYAIGRVIGRAKP